MVDDDLLAKHFAGETLVEEERAIQDWLADLDHVAHYDDLREVWQSAAKVRMLRPVDTNAAWLKLKQQMDHMAQPLEGGLADTLPTEAKVLPFVPLKKVQANPQMEISAPPPPARVAPRIKPLGIWRMAAAVALLALAGYFLYGYWDRPAEAIAVATFQAQAQPNTVKLVDSSTVALNRSSTLTFRLQTRLREATLVGEAYFQVAKNQAQPFVVMAQGTQVRVTGTAFNIKAYTPDSVSVVVTEGRVVFSVGANRLELSAGDRAVYERQSQQLHKYRSTDNNIAAYATRVFNFDQTPLGEVVQKLNEVYQANIALADPALQNCLLTVDFDNQELSTVLQIIADTLGLTIDQQPAAVVLSGPGCN